jgi:hypothetical protein
VTEAVQNEPPNSFMRVAGSADYYDLNVCLLLRKWGDNSKNTKSSVNEITKYGVIMERIGLSAHLKIPAFTEFQNFHGFYDFCIHSILPY